MSTTPLRVEKLADGREIKLLVTIFNNEYNFSPLLSAIRDLVIEESIVDWWSKGYIDIFQPNGALEGSLTDDNNSTYVFRNDCRDYISIELEQQYSSEGDDTRLNDPIMTLTHHYIVYSIKDLIEDNIKIKRLYFWDYRYEVFKEKDSTFTTTAYLSGNSSHMTDRDREIPTGEAIRMLITETDAEGREPEKIFSDQWDDGPHKILYTTQAGNCALDDLGLLLDQHVDSQNGKCVLYLDRANGEYSLIPIETLFRTAVTKTQTGQHVQFIPGSGQAEAFRINKLVDRPGDGEVIPATSRVPAEVNEPYINIHQRDSSSVSQYRYVEMRGDANHDILNTTAIHQYDSAKNTFIISMEENNMLSLVTYMRKNIIGNMQFDPCYGEAPMSINFSHDRFNALSMKHHYSPSTSSMTPTIYRNNTVWKLLMQSNAIEFDVPGEPNRQPGRFISIRHTETPGSDDNKHYDKIEGQYLVVSTIHRIEHGNYINRITGIKPYNYTDLFSDDTELVEYYEQI